MREEMKLKKGIEHCEVDMMGRREEINEKTKEGR